MFYCYAHSRLACVTELISSQILNSRKSTLECPPFALQQTFFLLNKRDSLARNEQTRNMFDIKRC